MGVWLYLSKNGASHAYAFVPLQTIAAGWRELIDSGELLLSIGASLQRTCLGLLYGSLAGLLLGSAMALSGFANRLFSPLYHTLRQVPILGLIPLIALWFGSGEGSKLLLISLAAFYPMTLSTFEGFRHVEKRHLEVAHILQLNAGQRFTQVLLPSALPSISAGMLHALAFAWISSVGSELFLSTGMGLGNMMMQAEIGARMEVVIIGVLCIGLMGFAMNTLFSRLSRHLLRWRNLR
jgi:sulfonate transport system permease protein